MSTSDHSLIPAADAIVDERRRYAVFTLAIVALTLPAAYFNGMILQRWGDPQELAENVQLLDQIDREVGDWRYVAEGEPIADYLVEELEIRGYVHRVYENRVTGQRVTMLILVGPAGPLVRHPPEVCYQMRANALLRSDRLTVDLGVRPAQLRLLAYQSASVVEGDFLVAYGFGDDGRWDVPSSPRLAYGGKSYLLKLHVLTDLASEPNSAHPQGLVDFLSVMLPHLNQTLMPQAFRPASPTVPGE